MKTCRVRSTRLDQYQNDSRETNDKLNPLYTSSMMINIFHDMIIFFFSWSFGVVMWEIESGGRAYHYII